MLTMVTTKKKKKTKRSKMVMSRFMSEQARAGLFVPTGSWM